ncbi:hypothetical protein F5Y12DRAFT_596160 [Xylaria sp. FL1777]|nr:hypothetical protein F5Y12DRAFT_596160 [Xylaria sp. FL1777]
MYDMTDSHDTTDSEETWGNSSDEHDEESLTNRTGEMAEYGSQDNAPEYNHSEEELPPVVYSNMQVPHQTSQEQTIKQSKSQEPKGSIPKKTRLRKVPKTLQELQIEQQAAERAHRKEIMDAEVAKVTAQYMKKSGGDLEKAAGFWFDREELKRQQPWPALEEAKATIESMKKDILNPTMLQLQMEEEEAEREEMERERKGKRREMEREWKRKREEKRKLKGDNKDVKSTQQSLGDRFQRGRDLSCETALGTSEVFPESYIRETQSREHLTSIQKDDSFTTSMETSVNPKSASELPDKQVGLLNLVRDDLRTIPMKTANGSTTTECTTLGEELALSTSSTEDKSYTTLTESASDNELALSTTLPKDILVTESMETSMNLAPRLETISKQAAPSTSNNLDCTLVASDEQPVPLTWSQKDEWLTIPAGTSMDQNPVVVASDGQVAPPSVAHQKGLLINPADTLLGLKSVSDTPEKQLESTIALQDVVVPSIQKASLPPLQPGEQGVISKIPAQRRRKREEKDLELGEHWTAHFTDDGHRPCVRHRQEKG